MQTSRTPFEPGMTVTVKPLAAILATLAADGTVDGLPFMPEMARHAGQRYVVADRLRKTCVEVPEIGFAAFPDQGVVLLADLRCDGAAHDGCQKACTLLWKDAWLQQDAAAPAEAPAGDAGGGAASLPTRSADGRYRCQSTELAHSVRPMTVRQWVHSVLTDWRHVAIAGLRVLWRRSEALLWRLSGRAIDRSATPLALQAGDRVRVRSGDAIVRTLDHRGTHRGLAFSRGMLAFCGKTFTVRSRIERMIREDTGRLVQLRDTVVLDDVVCDGIRCHGLCRRRQFQFWRECWLEPLPDSAG